MDLLARIAPLALVFACTVPAAAAPANRPAARARRVDLVLALDTSSSMNGLIDAARQKMWDMVTLLEKAQPRPELRVGLISYGNSGYDHASGWVRTDIDLTNDLDAVYGRLFGLTTGGGEEYVARAVQVATRSMTWSPDQDALRIVFVAGNESADQDPQVRLEEALAAARGRGIYVNAVYCGPSGAGDAAGWALVAKLGQGRFAAIDHNHTVAIAAPQDDELRRLSEALNHTYVAYGSAGTARQANQAAQDKNAAATSAPAAAARAVGKASGLYNAEAWDLVDATRNKKRDLATMDARELPQELAALPAPKRAEYVEEKAKARAELQGRIHALSGDRERYLAAERRKAKPAAASMDEALLGGIKQEAEAAGFSF